MKQLRKAKFQLEFVQKSVPELQNILSETQRELEAQKFGSRRQKEVVRNFIFSLFLWSPFYFFYSFIILPIKFNKSYFYKIKKVGRHESRDGHSDE